MPTSISRIPSQLIAGARARPGADGRRDGPAARGRRGGPTAPRISGASASRRIVLVASSRWSPSSSVVRCSGSRPRPGPIAVDNFRWIGGRRHPARRRSSRIALAHRRQRRARASTTAETHVLILLATSGMMLLAAARDLMIVFLGIELMSISVYALAGLNRRSARSAEGALKYFLLGAFSTAFLLYGIALVYGATGATEPRR